MGKDDALNFIKSWIILTGARFDEYCNLDMAELINKKTTKNGENIIHFADGTINAFILLGILYYNFFYKKNKDFDKFIIVGEGNTFFKVFGFPGLEFFQDLKIKLEAENLKLGGIDFSGKFLGFKLKS